MTAQGSRTATHNMVPILMFLLAGEAQAGANRFDAARSDPRATQVADRLMAALGGEKAWNELHYLVFTFQVTVNDTARPPRRHYWDKWTGWHRVEGKTGAGVPYCLIDNLNTHEGKAWMAGNAIEGDSLKKLMMRSYALWVNDSYWLCSPLKVKDPGVILAYDGERREGDQTWDRISLTFDGVGLTPGDHYWMHVNRATGRVDRWEFVLQGTQPPPDGYDWSGWQQVGGVWLATTKRAPGRSISFPGLAAPAALPAETFTSRAPVHLP